MADQIIEHFSCVMCDGRALSALLLTLFIKYQRSLHVTLAIYFTFLGQTIQSPKKTLTGSYKYVTEVSLITNCPCILDS